MDSVFVKSVIFDNVKLHPSKLTKNLRQNILKELSDKLEGKCSSHGYIKKNSIEIKKLSSGSIELHTFNGYIIYNVEFIANICNPSIGSILSGKVQRKNKFGIMVQIKDDMDYDIISIVIPLHTINVNNSEINPDNIQIGDILKIQIEGKRFEINDTQMSAVGKIIESTKDSKILIDIENSKIGGAPKAEIDIEEDMINSDIESDDDSEIEEKEQTDEEEESDVESEESDDLEDLEDLEDDILSETSDVIRN